jgi:hypothetical protein
MDVAQHRLDKAARVARGEAKAPAPASIDPAPLPPEAFANVAAEALDVGPLAAMAPFAHAVMAPPPTVWARVEKHEKE